MDKILINHNTANDGNILLSPVIIEAIQNDAQIKALLKLLNDLVQCHSPKYVLKTNGEFEVVYSEEYNSLFAKFIEQIEFRQSQIVSTYRWNQKSQ